MVDIIIIIKENWCTSEKARQTIKCKSISGKIEWWRQYRAKAQCTIAVFFQLPTSYLGTYSIFKPFLTNFSEEQGSK